MGYMVLIPKAIFYLLKGDYKGGMGFRIEYLWHIGFVLQGEAASMAHEHWFVYCGGLNNTQCAFEVYLRYHILSLYQESRTAILIKFEVPIDSHSRTMF